MQQPELKIEYVPVDSLIPYANNAKKHGEMDIDSLIASINECGFCDPVGVWTNAQGETEIVEGHGRVIAVKKLGMETIPVIYLDHLSDEKRRLYTHVHNQTTMNTGFDFDILESEIEALDFDWESFGFDTEEPFDAIEDLMSEGFVTNSMRARSDIFSITFNFSADLRDAITEYVKSVGKDAISAQIAKEALEWA